MRDEVDAKERAMLYVEPMSTGAEIASQDLPGVQPAVRLSSWSYFILSPIPDSRIMAWKLRLGT